MKFIFSHKGTTQRVTKREMIKPVIAKTESCDKPENPVPNIAR